MIHPSLASRKDVRSHSHFFFVVSVRSRAGLHCFSGKANSKRSHVMMDDMQFFLREKTGQILFVALVIATTIWMW